MIDQNIQEIDKQYRAYENIVSIDDIEKADKSSLLGIKKKTMRIIFLDKYHQKNIRIL